MSDDRLMDSLEQQSDRSATTDMEDNNPTPDDDEQTTNSNKTFTQHVTDYVRANYSTQSDQYVRAILPNQSFRTLREVTDAAGHEIVVVDGERKVLQHYSNIGMTGKARPILRRYEQMNSGALLNGDERRYADLEDGLADTVEWMLHEDDIHDIALNHVAVKVHDPNLAATLHGALEDVAAADGGTLEPDIEAGEYVVFVYKSVAATTDNPTYHRLVKSTLPDYYWTPDDRVAPDNVRALNWNPHTLDLEGVYSLDAFHREHDDAYTTPNGVTLSLEQLEDAVLNYEPDAARRLGLAFTATVADAHARAYADTDADEKTYIFDTDGEWRLA